jgi:hypothetical protein
MHYHRTLTVEYLLIRLPPINEAWAFVGEQRHSRSLPKGWCSLFDGATQPHRRDAFGKTCGRIGFDDDAAHRRRALCRQEPSERHTRGETPDRLFFLHPTTEPQSPVMPTSVM